MASNSSKKQLDLVLASSIKKTDTHLGRFKRKLGSANYKRLSSFMEKSLNNDNVDEFTDEDIKRITHFKNYLDVLWKTRYNNTTKSVKRNYKDYFDATKKDVKGLDKNEIKAEYERLMRMSSDATKDKYSKNSSQPTVQVLQKIAEDDMESDQIPQQQTQVVNTAANIKIQSVTSPNNLGQNVFNEQYPSTMTPAALPVALPAGGSKRLKPKTSKTVKNKVKVVPKSQKKKS